MTKCILVCFRPRGVAVRSTGGDLVTAVEGLVRTALALGGRIVAWDVAGIALSYAPDALEEVVDLVTGGRSAEGAMSGFSVGISEGEVRELVPGGASVSLSFGPALSRAIGLARIARAGEVLVDPLLPAVTAGELLTRGSRLGMSGRQRVRGQLLDLQHPWRRRVAVSPSRLVQPQLVGRSATRLPIQAGTVGVVVAGRGFGGTRFITDYAAGLPAVLTVTPHPPGEPLGALRHALVRSRLAGYEIQLAAEYEALLDALLAGEGLEREAAGALVAAWLGCAPERYVLVDDAEAVDADTMESVACACEDCGLRLLLRVDAQGELPPAAVELPRAFEVKLTSLSTDEAAQLAEALTAGQLESAAVVRIARRGGETPLGVAEALREGLESGDLAWRHDSVAPRSRHTAQGDTRTAAHWMFRRLRFLPPEARAALDALCVLGGEAPQSQLAELLRRLDVPVEIEAVSDTLQQGCWTTVVGKQLVSLASATLGRLLERVMDPARRAAWHLALAELLAESGRPLAAGSATLHALRGADLERAQALAQRAAASANAAGLVQTAAAFQRVATDLDLGALVARTLTASRALDDLLGPESVPHVPAEGRASQPGDVVGALAGEAEEAATNTVMVALREGKFEEVERVTGQLRQDPRQELLADRLDAMAHVVRGEAGDALRLLRSYKARSKNLSAAERCRAALAHSVGLAAAGRTTEALLEALEGLACAREASDARGEQACARFLEQLAERTGRQRAAGIWGTIAAGR